MDESSAYVAQMRALGYTDEQIRAKLTEVGYPAAVAESVTVPVTPPSHAHRGLVIAGILLFIVAAAVVVWFAVGLPSAQDGAPSAAQPDASRGTVSLAVTPRAAVDCTGLADAVAQCAPFACPFTHPFSGESLTKTVVGATANGCAYQETMPNGGMLSCTYSQAHQTAIAAYLTDMRTAAERGEVPVPGNTLYSINGVLVEDPLQYAYDDGSCAVTGY